MAKITITQDPSLYMRNSGLSGVMYNRMASSFTTEKNKEHSRPVPDELKPKKKVIK